VSQLLTLQFEHYVSPSLRLTPSPYPRVAVSPSPPVAVSPRRIVRDLALSTLIILSQKLQ
jgi:hypothetical protein